MVFWVVLWSGLAGLAVVGVVMTAAEIQAAQTDDAYFRGSTRLWLFVGAVLASMSLAMAPSLAGMGGSRRSGVVLGFSSLPAIVAVLACLYNAWSLVRVRRRRCDALLHGTEFDAVVLEREHKPFAHDILSITLRTALPDAAGTLPHHGGYRTEADCGTRSLDLVETCPGDQWGRLEPGRRVRVRVDPADPSRYALVLSGVA